MNQPRVESPERLATVRFGMWLFLASEAMFFTAFFAVTLIMRLAHPELLTPRPLPWGGALANSLVLAASLYFMAASVRKAKAGDARGAAAALGSTAGLGLVFLAVKAAGWAAEAHAGKLPSTNLFFGCYYALTGFEGLHVLIGVGVLLVLAWRAARGDFHARYYSPVLVTGLYWGLLAVVWALILLFLYV